MNNRPDITFFLPTSGGGGAEGVITTVAGELSARGYTIDLLLGESSGEETDESLNGVNVFGFDEPRLFNSIQPLCTYLRNNKPKVIVSTIYASNIIVALSHFLTRSDSRLVLRIANTPSVYHSSSSPKDITSRHLLPLSYQRADEIIAISRGVKQDLVKSFSVPESKISVVYNPIDLKRVDQLSTVDPDHPWFTVGDGEFETIVGMGRLTPQKDFETLLRAFERVHDRRSNTRLVVFGEGERRPALTSLANHLGIEEAVSLPGYVKNPYRYLSNADLFVLSSAWEGFGNVLLEALACECPIVSTDCPNGPREILADGKYGRLVPVGGVDAMKTAIIESLKEPNSPGELRDRASEFDVEDIVDQYETVLTKGTRNPR